MKLNPNGTSNEKPWADEPTPLCGEKRRTEIDRCGEEFDVVDTAFARDLERRLRHAWKMVNSLRIDATHCGGMRELDPELVDQRLADIEEVLQCQD